MKVTKTQLQKMVNEAVSSYLKENVQDKAIIEGLKPSFYEAIKQIKEGIKAYHLVMSQLDKAASPRVKDIGQRGMETSQHELERWNTIADDLYVAEWELDYDGMSPEDHERNAQYSDEHDNRGTLGEPKI